MTDNTAAERKRRQRHRAKLGLVPHTIETKPALIPEIDRFNRELLEREREQEEGGDG